jgi:hypothetical protein
MATSTPAPASAPASSQVASQPTSQPTEQAQTAWPPGLWMEALYAIGAKPALDTLGVRFWGFVEPGFMGRLNELRRDRES